MSNDEFDSNETHTHTLYRHHATDTSIEAAESLGINKLEALILKDIEEAGVWGLTQDDLISLHPRMSYSSITSRPSALKRKGLIFDSGERREGKSGRRQAVLKSVTFLALENNDQRSDIDGSTTVQQHAGATYICSF